MADPWVIAPPWEHVDEAVRRWRVPRLVAQLLHNRGVELDHSLADFVSPQLNQLIPPEELPGAEAAAAILAQAVRDGKSIVLYGDYDVDGIAGVALLWHVLTLAGAKVSFYVPHRLDEGYGLNVEAVQTLIKDGAQVIVSVDCGITAVQVAETARDLGATLIITDHHQPGLEIPIADAIVHPLSPWERAGVRAAGVRANPHLCGAGVAFKLAWAFARRLTGESRVPAQYRQLLTDLLPFVALATIADVVPLTGENRILVVHGLAGLPQTPWIGLRALMASGGLNNGKVSSVDVGYKLAPRLNAAGRLGHARLAVEMLTRADENRAREIATYLEKHNRDRQALERRVVVEACEQVEKRGMDKDSCRGIVLAAEGWHPGVIGIVAGRLAEKYRRPTVLIGLEKEVGQGSARGVEHFDVHSALSACAAHLTSHGGHAMAAGLKIQLQCVEAFTEAFMNEANARLTPLDLRKKIRLDAEVALADLNSQTVEALERLGPFGLGNPKPRLATGWLDLYAEPRTVGRTGDHVQAAFKEGNVVMRSIGFGKSTIMQDLKEHRRCRLAMEPMINDYQGRRTVEMRVLDYRFNSER